jgi:hypothetical protein
VRLLHISKVAVLIHKQDKLLLLNSNIYQHNISKLLPQYLYSSNVNLGYFLKVSYNE